VTDVKGVGVDLAQIPRLRRVVERWDDRFLRRVFTDEELAYCRRRRDPIPHLAARFAAKEAASKALGTGMSGGVGWTQIEVIQPGGRQPTLTLTGPALERFQALGCTASHLTLAHDGGIAVACVVIEG